MSSPARPMRYRGNGHPPAGIHSLRQRRFIQQVIATEGVFIQTVHGDGPATTYGYTVGLNEIGHPELVITGMPCPHMCNVLGWIAHPVLEHKMRLQAGMLLDLGGAPVAGLVEVAQPDLWLAVARDMWSRPVTELQVGLSDDQLRLPGERGYDREFVQPLLGNAAWTIPGWHAPETRSLLEPPSAS